MAGQRFTQADLDRLSTGQRPRHKQVYSKEEGRALLAGQPVPTLGPAEPTPAPSKLGNEPTLVDGVRYDSKAEARHAARLKLQLLAGELVVVERQVRYELRVNEALICTYVADFRVLYPDGRWEVQDVKGQRSGNPYTIFKLKKKLMAALLGIEVVEIS